MYGVPEELLKSILNYMASQPYGQVFGIVNQIQQCKPIENLDGEPDDDPPTTV